MHDQKWISLVGLLLCAGLNATMAETLLEGGYDVRSTMTMEGKIAFKRTDYIACFNDKDAKSMAFDFMSKTYQRCQKIAGKEIGRYIIQCLDKNNQPMEISVNETINNQQFLLVMDLSNQSQVVLKGRYKGACDANTPKQMKQEVYSVTPGYYDFTVTTKVDDVIVRNTEEKRCIRSGQSVIGGILLKSQQDCQVRIDSQSQNYFAVTLKHCKELTEGESIHFSTMSKERSLSTLLEITKIEDGNKKVVSEFKMGRLLGECE